MKLYGLIGYPLSHSFSQAYFRKKFKNEGFSNCDYLNFSIKDISEISDIINEYPELEGFNVTIPYKELIIKYLDNVDAEADEISAVNTVKIIREEGEKVFLKGYNTDIYGFEQSLKPLLSKRHKHALILGTGGASKAVAFVLKKLDIDYLFVSRKEQSNLSVNYRELDKTSIIKHTLIINTTPLGMFPHIEHYPDIPFQFINKNHLLFDLIYNPLKTRFLEKGEMNDAMVTNGYRMLELQAEKAWEIFNRENF
ncbi:MAG: shikimate dehydrogenase [Bacteroidota bacterium]